MVEVVLLLGQPTSTPKNNFCRDRYNGDYQKSQHQHTSTLIVLFRSRDYPVGASGSFLFDDAYGYGKGGLGPSKTDLISQKVDCWIDGDNFFLSRSIKYSSIGH